MSRRSKEVNFSPHIRIVYGTEIIRKSALPVKGYLWALEEQLKSSLLPVPSRYQTGNRFEGSLNLSLNKNLSYCENEVAGVQSYFHNKMVSMLLTRVSYAKYQFKELTVYSTRTQRTFFLRTSGYFLQASYSPQKKENKNGTFRRWPGIENSTKFTCRLGT